MSIGASIIVATYNRASLLADTLDSLLINLSSTEYTEIVVVNNNSTDGTLSVAKSFIGKFPMYRIVTESKQGLSYARNRGVTESHGDILVFLDDDVEVHSGWLQALLAPLSDPNVAVTGGKVLPFGAQAIPDWLPREYCFLASVFDPHDMICEVPKVMGGNSAVRRRVLLEVGLYDVKLGRKGSKLLGGEEIELQMRIRGAGHKIIYTPHAVIWHKIGEKLNREYIGSYAYWLGVSDAVIEESQSKRVKYLLKMVRSSIFPWCVFPLQWLLNKRDPAAAMRYSIRRNYARGYLSHKEALAEDV